MEPRSAAPSHKTIRKIDLHPDKALHRNFTFSSCVVAGDYIFTSFQAGDPNDDIKGQTEQCFRNLERTLKAAGTTLTDVVKMTVLIKNPADFRKMDDIYKRQFADGYPARITTIVAGFLDPKLLIQIDAVAYKPR